MRLGLFLYVVRSKSLGNLRRKLEKPPSEVADGLLQILGERRLGLVGGCRGRFDGLDGVFDRILHDSIVPSQ